MNRSTTLTVGALVLAGLLFFVWQPMAGPDQRGPNSSRIGDSERPATLEGQAQPKSGTPIREVLEPSERESAAGQVAPATGATTGELAVQVLYAKKAGPAAYVELRYYQVRQSTGATLWRRATLDAHGRVLLKELKPGRVTVMCALQEEPARAEILAGQTAEMTLELREGIDIRGTVVDKQDVPVPHATLVLMGWASSRLRVVGKADQAGRFDLKQCDQMCNLGARATGFAPSALRGMQAVPGSKIECKIVMTQLGGAVRGRVIDSKGAPVADATVFLGKKSRFDRVIRLTDGSQGMNPPRVWVVSDADGRVAAIGDAVGEQPIEVESEGFEPYASTIQVVVHAKAEVVVKLVLGVVCEGVVTDEVGKPVAETWVQFREWNRPGFRQARTDENGAYRLAGLPAGPVRLRVRTKRRGKASVELIARTGELLRWDPKLSRGRVFRAVVTGADKAALAAVKVELSAQIPGQSRGWYSSGASGKDGAFEIPNCPEGAVIQMRLQKRGYEHLDRSKLDAEAGPHRFAMRWEGEANVRIIGRLLDENGESIEAAGILLARVGDGSSGVFTTKKDGRIRIEKQRPGSYLMEIQSKAHARYRLGSKDLRSGETWDVGEIRMARGGCVEVEPRGWTREDGVRLHVYSGDGEYLTWLDPKAKVLRSPAIRPGRFELRVSGEGVVPGSQFFEITEGQDTKLVIEVRRGQPIDLEFELPSGTELLRKMEFEIRGGSGFLYRHKMTRSRDYPFKRSLALEPGIYQLQCRAKPALSGQLEIRVPKAFKAGQALKVPMK